MTYSIKKIRSDFPILSRKINKKSLIYLDNAASAQKPNIVIDSITAFYKKKYSSVHRSVHTLNNEATSNMEKIRKKIAKFINAKSYKEIIFTKGTTESINLVANTWGRKFLHLGDQILITEMEHHANIVPWQILAKEKNIKINYIPMLPDGNLDIEKMFLLINNHTKLFSITYLSNVLGILNPIDLIIKKAKKINKNIKILIDGAQSTAHCLIDVQKLNCDFYAFSGHKIYGPSGIGILYGKESILDTMPPWEGGGSMIQKVSLHSETTFNYSPWKFEAGSPNISGIIGLGSAIDYIKKINMQKIFSYEKEITSYAVNALQQIPNIIIYGTNFNRVGVISFNIKGCHSYDIGILLDQEGIAIRVGHHCAMPLMNFFDVHSMCRISLAMYNTKKEIDQLINSLLSIQCILKSKKRIIN